MNAGILRVTLKALEAAWGIPEGHHIERIQYEIEDSYTRTVKLLVTGPTLPEYFEGNAIPWVEGIIDNEMKQLTFKW